MNKLLTFLDKYVLKIGVIFALVFTALYPKLPSIQVTNTWVYIRLEDFVIALVVGLWLFLLLRKKVRLALPIGISLGIYWLVGGISLLYCLIFIAPHLANFFPKIAALEWLRRIEYMILFFVAFSTVKTVKDIRDYCVALGVMMVGIVLYGIGQHYYLFFWHLFPKFFEKYPFCFPSFQTGNEEFAKGIPLCLPADGRDTSTFGGHYDLAAYLVLVLPLLFTFIFMAKKKISQVLLSCLFLSGLVLLLFTASRTSFATYLVGITATVVLLKKKKLLIPVWIISILMLLLFSGSTAKRFMETIRFTSIVTNSQGQVVGVAQSTLPKDLQNKISKNPVVVSDAIPTQNLPAGSSFITLPQAPVATSVAVVKSKVSNLEAERLKLQYGGLEISTVSGSFLIQKALVYDISFTTRFQAEWPRDFAAFVSSPIFGTGYSSLTLASDNDYLRALGETGALGLAAFLGIFLVFAIFLKNVLPEVEDTYTKLFLVGLAGGVVGLFANAVLIDVFESSKVAEGLWILLGVGAGALALYQKKKVHYKDEIISFLTSHFMLGFGILVVTLITFMRSIGNFFVGDDFTWLRWAATSTFSDVPKYFTNAQGFFYRPIDKAVMLFLYTFFSFQPQGYHIFTIFTHFLVGIGIYFFLLQLFRKKLWAVVGSLLFILLPAHGENLYWVASLSPNLSTLFIIFGLVAYNKSWDKIQSSNFVQKGIYSAITVLLAVGALLSYEMAVIFPLLLIALDVYRKRAGKKQWITYGVFVVLDALYLVVRTLAHTVAAGGDYSYNLLHSVPNIVGNFLGYVSLFLIGEPVVSIFAMLRSESKAYVLPVTIFLLIVVCIGVFILTKNKRFFHLPSLRLFLFGIVFAVIGLLPFLPLGDMAPRYLYLGSVGFIIALLAILVSLFEKLYRVSPRITWIVGAIFVVIVTSWYNIALQKQSQDWQHAGKITYTALGYFKIEQADLPQSTTLYIVNRPVRYGSAWVFPVGFPDGLWFVYRDDTQIVNYADSLSRARALAGKDNPYIFIFDTKGNIQQAQ